MVVLEEEPVASETHDHQLESDPNPVDVCNKSSASLEMTERVLKERIHRGCSPQKGDSGDLSHQEGLESRSFHFFPTRAVCLSSRQEAVLVASKYERNEPAEVTASLSSGHHRALQIYQC